MTAPNARQSDELRELIPHQDWCHSGTHADCCGTPDDQWSCDCGAHDQRVVVTAWAEKQARARAAEELRKAATNIRQTTILGHIAERLEHRADALAADDRTDPA